MKALIHLKQVTNLNQLMSLDKNGNLVRSLGKDIFLLNNVGEFEIYILKANAHRNEIESAIDNGRIFILDRDAYMDGILKIVRSKNRPIRAMNK